MFGTEQESNLQHLAPNANAQPIELSEITPSLPET